MYYTVNDKGFNLARGYKIVNIYALNIGAPKYIKQNLTDIKGDIDSNRILVGDFNTHLHKWIG